MEHLEELGLIPMQLEKAVRRKHIFTHIIWDMQGIYAEVENTIPDLVWMTAAEIDRAAALPTAFRLFWEEEHHV